MNAKKTPIMLSRRFAKQTTELKELKREVAQINEELTCAVASVVQKMVPRRQYDKLVSDIQTLSAEMKVLVEDKRRMRDTIHALTEHVDLQNAFIAVSRRKRVECCSCCYVDVEDAVRCEWASLLHLLRRCAFASEASPTMRRAHANAHMFCGGPFRLQLVHTDERAHAMQEWSSHVHRVRRARLQGAR